MGDGRGPVLVAVIGFFLALSWLFVLLRCYCRIILVKSFGLDDIFCLLAQLLYTVYCAIMLVMVDYGWGQHMVDVPPENVPIALKLSLITDPFYVFGNMALKFSIGIFLLRICVSRAHRIILWCVMVVSGIVSIVFCLMALFQCSPVSYFWEQGTGVEGSCLSPKVIIGVTYTYTAMSCWSDWTYSILPIFVMWKLQMHLQAKILVCLILGVSSLASIVTIIRIPSISTLDGEDFLYNVAMLTLWSICETGLALTACAAATLRSLVRLVSTKFNSHLPSDIAMHTSRKTAHQDTWPAHARYSRKDGRLDDEMRIQTEIGANATGIDGDTNHRWPEDDRSSNAEADRISNSSQAKLKMDTGLAATNSSAGITKTVVVTTRSMRA